MPERPRPPSGQDAVRAFHRKLVRLAGRVVADRWVAQLRRLGRLPGSDRRLP
jgi:hypothetical protein